MYAGQVIGSLSYLPRLGLENSEKLYGEASSRGFFFPSGLDCALNYPGSYIDQVIALET